MRARLTALPSFVPTSNADLLPWVAMRVSCSVFLRRYLLTTLLAAPSLPLEQSPFVQCCYEFRLIRVPHRLQYPRKFAEVAHTPESSFDSHPGGLSTPLPMKSEDSFCVCCRIRSLRGTPPWEDTGVQSLRRQFSTGDRVIAVALAVVWMEQV